MTFRVAPGTIAAAHRSNGMQRNPKSPTKAPFDDGRGKPAPVTVSRYLPDGSTESITIDDPPPRFRVDWDSRSVVPVEIPPRRWRR